MGEIYHFGHTQHPLKLIENWETNAYVGDDDVEGVVDCDGCLEHISGGSAYGCVPCSYFLHKTCAELIPTVNHHFHPLHPLTLSPRPYYGWNCNVCGKRGFQGGFSYWCEECDFDACLKCGPGIALKEGEIHHLGHIEHLLKLIKNWETAAYVGDDVVKGVVDCDGCREHISGGSAYGCVPCHYFLHKTCAEAELKPTMNHPCHPLHPLTLSPRPYDSWKCNVCGKGRFKRGFSYKCSKCDLHVCIECVVVVIAQEIAAVALKKEASIKFKYEGHPQHTLTLQLRSASFRCDACNVKDEDLFYQCDDCDFWIHKGCTTLVRTISLTQHHHSLTLVYSLPDNFYTFPFYCDFCNKQVLQKDWLYHCANCRYFAHIKCALNAQHPSIPRDGPGTSSVDEDQVNDLLQFPMPYAFTDPLKLLHSQKITQDEDDETTAEINHWSHDHPLILNNVDSEGNNIDLGADADPVKVCYGCVRPLSFPYYSCNKDGCPFFLHKYCAELPLTLDKHQLHPDHRLHLVAVTLGDSWVCKVCLNSGNTFSYKCETCEFYLDVNCASLPNTIKHEFHYHPLIQVIDPEHVCDLCNKTYDGISYACKVCSFQLDMHCALRSPSSLGHRYCKGHDILLTYPPVEEHPEDFYCDFCEKEMHPKRPLYYCQQCKNSFHLDCLSPTGKFANMWSEGTITESYHKHPLTFVRRKKSPEYVCSKCNVDINGRLILECRSKACNFNMCYKCHDESTCSIM